MTLKEDILNQYNIIISKLETLQQENREVYDYYVDLHDNRLILDTLNCPLCIKFYNNNCKGCPLCNGVQGKLCSEILSFKKLARVSYTLFKDTLGQGYFVKMKLIEYIDAVKAERQFLSELEYDNDNTTKENSSLISSVQTIKDMKDILEKDIWSLISKFETDTGLRIKDLQITSGQEPAIFDGYCKITIACNNIKTIIEL